MLRASSVGAQLDTDLMKGGGTDDTAVLQRVLDLASDGTPVHLIVDGAALVSGLNAHRNTTIECLDGGGLYLKDGSSRAIIRNANRSKRTITDEHITVRGCFLNGNRDRQPSAELPRPDLPWCCTPSNRESDGTFIGGLQFLGVNDLIVENVTLWNIRAFGMLVANASRIAITNLTVDHGNPGDIDPSEFRNTDGLVLKGPLQYATVNGLKLRTGDDGLAVNADTWPEDRGNLYGPYIGVGPITDVSVNNVQFMNTIVGIRLLSAKERIDRVTISNVTGKISGCCGVAVLSHWINPSGLGNFGSIVFDNVNVDRSYVARKAAIGRVDIASEGGKIEGDQAKWLAKEFNEGAIPYISINSHVESLSVRNIVTKVSDARPILRLGSDALVKMLTAELTLLDPNHQALPLKLDQGSRIERLDFALRWMGRQSDEGQNPIMSLGGTVGQLHWINTPPLFASAELVDGNRIVVTFTQPVKAIDFKAGVDIKMNGKHIAIVRAMREPDRLDIVSFELEELTHTAFPITWAYDATAGSIKNWSGNLLSSISERVVIGR